MRLDLVLMDLIMLNDCVLRIIPNEVRGEVFQL